MTFLDFFLHTLGMKVFQNHKPTLIQRIHL